MPRFSLTSHCRICGKEIAQSGPARQWVHLNEFYAKADHQPEPRENSPYVMAKRDPAPPAKAAEPKRGAGRALRQWGAGETPEPAKPRPARRRFGPAEPEQNTTDLDEAARRLRRLRYEKPSG